VVTPALLRQVLGVEAEGVPDPRTGVPLCIAYGLAAPLGEHVGEVADTRVAAPSQAVTGELVLDEEPVERKKEQMTNQFPVR
jgi:hypothetical protein